MTPSVTYQALSSRGGVVAAPSTQRRDRSAGKGGVGSKLCQPFPLRLRGSATKNEVIVIDSEDSDSSCEGTDSSHEPAHSPLQYSLSKTTGRTSTAGLPTPPASKPAVVKDDDAAQYRLPDAPSNLAPSYSLNDTHRSGTTSGPVPRRSGSVANAIDAPSHRSPATPSTRARPSCLDSSHLSMPRSSNKTGEVAQKRAYVNVVMSRENPASSSPATTASATGLNSTLRRDPHHIPPTFPPAVKARIYSDSERGSQGNSSTKSKKLEALGFASGTQPAARTANATKRENASVGTVAPTPLCKSKPPPIPRPSIKRVKQEAEEPAQAQITAFLTVPRTPEQPTAMRRAYNWSSPSIGTSADPYTLSSDDDDDDDDDDTATTHGKPYNLPPLQSFANIADMYETASDVEAVLDQFPAWLSTPSPPEPRSINRSVPPTSRPITAPRLNGRPGADEDGNRSGERRESRRVRFRGDDGFSSSPVPPKRVVAPIERASPRAKRIHVSSKSSPPCPKRIASRVDQIATSEITSNEPTSCNFNYDDDGGSSAQHRKDIQSRKWRKLKARSREDKRASRHRNKNREAWRRQKKAKRGHSI